MNVHLTDAGIKRLPLPAKGNRVTFDDNVAGFGIRVTAAGARSFVLNYRTKAGRERRITIGQFENRSTVAARAKARELKQLVEDGGDPLADLEEEREAPTVADLIEQFTQEHLPKRRFNTARDYTKIIRKWIGPHFGAHAKVSDVTFSDVDALHRKITAAGSPYVANRAVGILSKMFNLSVRWQMRTDNPAKGVEKNSEQKRKRYLSGEELGRLVEELTKYPDQQVSNIVRLLLLTGARKGEILAMQYADVDLTAGIWSKPAASTKRGTEHIVPLSAPARQLLSEIAAKQKRPLGKYVFPGPGSTGHVVRIAWHPICKLAGITGLRIHDLRHSFASQLVSSGASLPLIGALLGHTQVQTTHRYAHLFDDPQRAAVERVGAIISAAGKPELAAPVQLKPRRRR